ncbi:hypothetical protein KPSA3_05337 [Pseudomonas syringae pv. actinidiae]|uniref:Uncharacterized protein n=1 Tax=Pseudomonas syringae pv. actinidiae TaxID=103796 RepID=A0AAN4QAD1_PSESF|nr:hypothetical protein KPSA3_05337 [Pseudomonas syringae pv. actinidiae]
MVVTVGDDHRVFAGSVFQAAAVVADHFFGDVIFVADRCVTAFAAVRTALAASAAVAGGVVGARAVAGVAVDGFLDDSVDD